MNIEEHVVTALQNAEISRDYFPIFYAENVFPADFYASMQEFLAQKEDFETKKFANRNFTQDNTIPGLEFMYTKDFFYKMLHLFDPELEHDFGNTKTIFAREIRLIRDQQHYKIGPHTDAPWKVLSLLFYLPPDDSLREYGTSIFQPKDQAFRCVGGPHHPFEPFTEVWRAPFLPNTCLGFWKTDHSFHGVYPIPVPVRRDVLLFNIYRRPDAENNNGAQQDRI